MNAAAQALTAGGHAQLVANLSSASPSTWAAIYSPNDYVFDVCEICQTPRGKKPHPNCGRSLALEMASLRAGFHRATDQGAVNRILRQLISLEARARRMSIGVRVGGHILYGEAV